MPMPCSPEITPSRLRASAMMRATRLVRGLQHGVVVAVDGDVGVHVAVAGVHVQRHPDAAAQHVLVDARGIRRAMGTNAAPAKSCCSGFADLRLPRRAQRASCSMREEAAPPCSGCATSSPASQRDHSARTSRSSASACCTRSSSNSALGISPASSPLPSGRVPRAKKCLQRVDQLELVAQRQLDVDALDAVGVLAHARQRDHHVFVDLEGVGVLGDRRGALAVEPELLARFGADGDEAFAARASWRCARPRWWRAPRRRRRRRRCRRTAPSSAGRCPRPRVCSWWRSRRPSGSGRRGAPARPALHCSALARRTGSP